MTHAITILEPHNYRGHKHFLRCACSWQTIRLTSEDCLSAFRVHLATRGIIGQQAQALIEPQQSKSPTP